MNLLTLLVPKQIEMTHAGSRGGAAVGLRAALGGQEI
jgi:hypothetical protein